jgi:hypothetical protein
MYVHENLFSKKEFNCYYKSTSTHECMNNKHIDINIDLKSKLNREIL